MTKRAFKDKMVEMADEIFLLDEEIARLQAQRDEKADIMFNEMNEHEMDHLESQYGEADIIEKRKNAKTEFNKEAIYKKLSHKDFLESVNIVKGKLEKVMSGREIEAVSKVIPGGVAGYDIKFTPYTEKK